MTPTPYITRLRSLLDRCEKASGPDHRLDGDIAVALGLFVPGKFQRGEGLYADRWFERGRVSHVFEAQHVTHSLDAAVALIEKALPGWHWEVGRDSSSMVSRDEFSHMGQYCWANEAKTPPLALLSALLKALIAREEQRAGEEKEG